MVSWSKIVALLAVASATSLVGCSLITNVDHKGEDGGSPGEAGASGGGSAGDAGASQ